MGGLQSPQSYMSSLRADEALDLESSNFHDDVSEGVKRTRYSFRNGFVAGC